MLTKHRRSEAAPAAPTTGVMRVRNHSDYNREWSTDDPASVAAAAATFDMLRRAGCLAVDTTPSRYETAPRGERVAYGGEVMRDFDPTAERIEVRQQYAGG